MKSFRWRVAKPCADCPFNTSGPGLHLRRSLGVKRWRGILAGLRNGQHFKCHKTTNHTGNGTNLTCAGAIAWQHARGLTSNMQRVMESLDYFRAKRA